MQLRDQTWTTRFGGRIEVCTADGDLVAVVSDTATATYIADMHNAQLDRIENSLGFDYDKLISELREVP